MSQTLEGRERYPINLRYPQGLRNSPEQLALLPIVTLEGVTLTLGDVTEIRIEQGPPMIKSDNARPTGWIFIDITTDDLGGYVTQAGQLLNQALQLPAGYSIEWAGLYQYMERVAQRLRLIVPMTLALIVVLLYLNFGRQQEVWIVMLTLPMALVGSVWMLWWFNFQLSVAVIVGMIALAGVAVETSVLMLLYLQHAESEWRRSCVEKTQPLTHAGLREAVISGAALRLRPKSMTVATIVIGLMPLLYADGVGAEVMSRNCRTYDWRDVECADLVIDCATCGLFIVETAQFS